MKHLTKKIKSMHFKNVAAYAGEGCLVGITCDAGYSCGLGYGCTVGGGC